MVNIAVPVSFTSSRLLIEGQGEDSAGKAGQMRPVGAQATRRLIAHPRKQPCTEINCDVMMRSARRISFVHL